MMKFVKRLCLVVTGIILLCLSPFIILFLTHWASKPFNNLVMSNLIDNYGHFEHPIPSERVGELNSFVDKVWGNGDWWGPCVMNVTEIRRTSLSQNPEKISDSYEHADLAGIKHGLPALAGRLDGFTYMAFAGSLKENSYLYKSSLPFDKLWLSRYKEMSKMQEEDPSHRYYLLNLEFPTEMKGADWRCITI